MSDSRVMKMSTSRFALCDLLLSAIGLLIGNMCSAIYFLTFMGPCIVIIFLYMSNKMQSYTVYFIWELLYMFRVVPSPIIRSENNCIYSIWYLSYLYCYLPLSWKSWNQSECAVGGVSHPQITVAVWQIPDAVDTLVFAPDDGWWYHQKHLEQFPDKINCVTFASCWLYFRICVQLFWLLRSYKNFNLLPACEVQGYWHSTPVHSYSFYRSRFYWFAVFINRKRNTPAFCLPVCSASLSVKVVLSLKSSVQSVSYGSWFISSILNGLSICHHT
jgi:hypothetical protein